MSASEYTTAKKTASVDVVPFFRLSNLHITGTMASNVCADTSLNMGFSSLRDLGLYSMIGALLSNPSFTYASGGLQKLLLMHCKNRYFSLHASFKRLQETGYLLRTRIPMGKNCFRDYYTLSQNAQNTPSPAVHLRRAQSKAFLSAYQPFTPPTEDFTKVSIPMLMDPRLSLSAKGLYAVIARFIRISEYSSACIISKDMLRKVCKEGHNAFDRIFRELRCAGYLSLIRVTDARTAKPRYLYVLSATASQVDPISNEVCQVRQKTSSVRIEKQQNRPIDQRKAEPPHLDPNPSISQNQAIISTHIQPQSMSEIEKTVREQIEYPCLCEEYPTEKLNCIVSIISSFLHSAATDRAVVGSNKTQGKTVSLGRNTVLFSEVNERFKQLDSEDIRFVLDSYTQASKSVKIRNLRAYLTTCLFHAKENLALALESLADTVPGSTEKLHPPCPSQ